MRFFPLPFKQHKFDQLLLSKITNTVGRLMSGFKAKFTGFDFDWVWGQWLKCNRAQGNAVPYLQKMAQGVPSPQIFYGRR